MPRSFTFDRYVQLLYSIVLDAMASGFPRQVVHGVTVEMRKKESLLNEEEEEDNDQRPGPSNRACSSIEDEIIAPELQYLLFEELPPALLSPPQKQQQPAITAIPEEEEEDWLQEPDHPVLDLFKPNLKLQIASLYALLCLFHAQPSQNFPSVKIYLTKEHQAAFLNMLPDLSAAAEGEEQQYLEAQSVAKYLLDNAFVLGGGSSAQVTTASSAALKSPGISTNPLFNPQAAEEAAIVREVKYQLSSALKGLGAKFLPLMYDDYREKLEHVWKVTAPPGGGDGEASSLEKGGNAPPQPQPISDLSLGKLLNQYVEYKGAEVQYLLAHGKKWRIRKLARGIPKSAGLMETEAVKSLSTGVFKSQQQLQRIEEEAEETTTTGGRKEVQSEQTEAEEVTKQQKADLSGLPPSARRAMERQVKRKQEIKKRAKAWTDRMGIDATNLAASGGGDSFEDVAALQQHGDDDDEDSLMEDMPTDLPGLHDWIPPSATAATLSMYDYEEEGEGREGGCDATPPGAVAYRNAGGMSTGGAITEGTVEQRYEGEGEGVELTPQKGSSKGRGKQSSGGRSSESSKKAKKLKPVDTKKLESVLAEQAEIVKRTLAQAQTEQEDYD